jgi:hypothetical protein
MCDEMVRHSGTHAQKGNEYTVYCEAEEKRKLRGPRCRCVDNIKMDLVEIICSGIDWIHQAWDRNN